MPEPLSWYNRSQFLETARLLSRCLTHYIAQHEFVETAERLVGEADALSARVASLEGELKDAVEERDELQKQVDALEKNDDDASDD